MKKVLVNIPERKYVPTLGMGPHRMVYLRSDLVRPLRAYGLIIQVLKEERRKLHVDVPTERKVETETVASQPTTTVSAQPTTTAPPVQPTFKTPKTDVPVNNTPEFTGGVNGTEAAVSETEEALTPIAEEKHEEAPVASQPEITPTVTEPAHTEEQPQPNSTETPAPAVEEKHEEAVPVVSQPETVVEAPKTETTSEVAHVEETTAPVSEPVAEEKHEEAPVASQPEVAPTATEENTPVEETNEVPDTEVTTEPVAAAGTYSTTTGRTIEISEEEYALLSREGVTKQELKDLLNAKGFRTLYRDTLKDLFAKFGIEY